MEISVFILFSYMILAPATMQAEADPKIAASKCLEEVGLDPDSYRIGHTKASRHKPARPLLFYCIPLSGVYPFKFSQHFKGPRIYFVNVPVHNSLTIYGNI